MYVLPLNGGSKKITNMLVMWIHKFRHLIFADFCMKSLHHHKAFVNSFINFEDFLEIFIKSIVYGPKSEDFII